jgi:hypothetical protein
MEKGPCRPGPNPRRKGKARKRKNAKSEERTSARISEHVFIILTIIPAMVYPTMATPSSYPVTQERRQGNGISRNKSAPTRLLIVEEISPITASDDRDKSNPQLFISDRIIAAFHHNTFDFRLDHQGVILWTFHCRLSHVSSSYFLVIKSR